VVRTPLLGMTLVRLDTCRVPVHSMMHSIDLRHPSPAALYAMAVTEHAVRVQAEREARRSFTIESSGEMPTMRVQQVPGTGQDTGSDGADMSRA
jgi:hypothetical protein